MVARIGIKISLTAHSKNPTLVFGDFLNPSYFRAVSMQFRQIESSIMILLRYLKDNGKGLSFKFA